MASGTPGAPGPAEPGAARGWSCPEHSERLAELFCLRCSRCVCALCPVLGAHRGHPVGLAQEEAARVQKLIQGCLEHLAIKKQQLAGNIAQTEDTGERLKNHAEASKAWLREKFTQLRLLLDEEEVLAKNFVDKNTQLALQAYREQVESCGKQIEAVDDLSNRVRTISQESNPVQLLQAYIATKSEIGQQMSSRDLSHPEPLSFEPVKTFFKDFMEAIQNTLQTPMDTRLKDNARTPSLDPDSMHARLRLSKDGLSVRCALLGRWGSPSAPRFDALWQVLGRDCFAAGRHYWEVDVQEAGSGWWVGAAYPSLRRRGATAAARLGCNRQSWCVKRYDLEYWAFHDCQRSRLWLRRDPDRLGVFLDYEAGVLAFYDVTGGMRHLHTFYAAFQEPLYPALRLWEGTISVSRLP